MKRLLAICLPAALFVAPAVNMPSAFAGHSPYYESGAIKGEKNIQKMDRFIRSLPAVQVFNLGMLPQQMLNRIGAYVGDRGMVYVQRIDGKTNKSYFVMERVTTEGGDRFGEVFDQNGTLLYYFEP